MSDSSRLIPNFARLRAGALGEPQLTGCLARPLRGHVGKCWAPWRLLLAVSLLALFPLLSAAAEEERPNGNLQRSETVQETTGAPTEIIRRLPLSRLGFEKGLVLEGEASDAEVLFPLARDLPIGQAGLSLSLDYKMALSEVASLRIDVDDVPRAAEALAGEGHLALPLPLDASKLQGDPLSLRLSFRASRSGDRCLDDRILPDYVLLRPESALHLAVDAHAVKSLASAWAVLPQQVTISLSREPLSPENFAALLEISRRLLASGRELRYRPLPEIPENAAVGVLASGLASARSSLFTGSADGREDGFEIGHILVASEEELSALEAAVKEAQTRFRRFSGAEEGELPEPQTQLQPPEEEYKPMRLVRFLDYPVIAAGGSDPAATAAILASAFAAISEGAELDVTTARLAALEGLDAESVTFAELGFQKAFQEGSGRSLWLLEFGLQDLPSQRLPSSLELELVLPQRDEGRLSDPLDIYLNDVLLASLAPGRSGERRREVVSLPSQILASNNFLRIELRRNAGGTCSQESSPAPAQILGSSLIRGGREISQPSDFLEMIVQMGDEPLFLLPKALLQQADEVMPLLARLTNTLLSEARRPKLLFYEDRLPTVDRPFLLIGLPQGRLPDAPLKLDGERLELRGGRDLLLEASAPEQAAVLQLARLDDWSGFWLLPDGEGRYPAPPTLLLDRSDIAWLDEDGISLAFQSDRASARYSWARPWLKLLQTHRQIVLIGSGLLTLTVLLLLWAGRKRRRKKARD